MSWHFLERWVEKANQYSTLVGKIWITFLIVCRMVIVASVGDRVYSDEQSEFKCNTLQPGCTNVCFNQFSPISHLRFWSFQILVVATPSVLFAIFSGHKTSEKKSATKRNAVSHDENEIRAKEKRNFGRKENLSRLQTSKIGKTSLKLKEFLSPTQQQPLLPTSFQEKKFKGLEHEKTFHNSRVKSTLIRLPNFYSNESKCDIKLEDELKFPNVFPSRKHSEKSRFSHKLSADNKNNIIYDAIKLVDNTQNPPNAEVDNKRSRNNNNNSNEIGKATFWKHPTMIDQKQRHIRRLVDPSCQGNGILDEQSKAPCRHPLNDDITYNKDHIVSGDIGSFVEADMHQPLFSGIKQPPHNHADNSFASKSNLAAAKPENGDEGVGQQDQPFLIPGNAYAPNPIVEKPKFWEDQPLKSKRNRESKKFNFKKGIIKNDSLNSHFYWYLINVFVRLLLEIAFTIGQIILFGFKVPDMYKCKRWPCPNTVDCFSSRPKEKTIFLWFMFIYNCICVLLNFCELAYLLYVYAKHYCKKRAKMYDGNEAEIFDETNDFIGVRLTPEEATSYRSRKIRAKGIRHKGGRGSKMRWSKWGYRQKIIDENYIRSGKMRSAREKGNIENHDLGLMTTLQSEEDRVIDMEIMEREMENDMNEQYYNDGQDCDATRDNADGNEDL
ncbi:unnamed protein product [Clavelina lepadiformis]|uniref:Gap junction protein n=1 Tax=Clavelina lepadiformis TaxID=159417 RepID=A0ABP0EXA9_CLALP